MFLPPPPRSQYSILVRVRVTVGVAVRVLLGLGIWLLIRANIGGLPERTGQWARRPAGRRPLVCRAGMFAELCSLSWYVRRRPCPVYSGKLQAAPPPPPPGGHGITRYQLAYIVAGIIACTDYFAQGNYGGVQFNRPCKPQNLSCLMHTLHCQRPQISLGENFGDFFKDKISP